MLSNSNLEEILQHHFEADADLKQKCLVDAKNKITRNLANRVFDDFPLLLAPSKFLSLTDNFKTVLKQPTGKSVKDFERDLIQIACHALLDNQGKLKNCVINMLEWNELTSQIDNYNAVCAFVGAVNAHIVNESASLIQENNNKFTATASFINHNYGKWVLEIMREKCIPYDSIYNTDQLHMRDIILYPIKKPGFAASLLFGGFIGAAIYGGYELYKQRQRVADTVALDLPDSPKRSP